MKAASIATQILKKGFEMIQLLESKQDKCSHSVFSGYDENDYI